MSRRILIACHARLRRGRDSWRPRSTPCWTGGPGWIGRLLLAQARQVFAATDRYRAHHDHSILQRERGIPAILRPSRRALMRIAWRTVGGIISRVVDEAKEGRDMLEGLTRIGVDEISFRKGQRYLTVIIDHDTGRLVWAAEGRDKKTL